MKYEKQNIEDLEPYYSEHVLAMTTENLYKKSDIAAQLAVRDKSIDKMLGWINDENYVINKAFLIKVLKSIALSDHIGDVFEAIDPLLEELDISTNWLSGNELYDILDIEEKRL